MKAILKMIEHGILECGAMGVTKKSNAVSWKL